MSTLKTNAAQIGQSATPTQNFTLYTPNTPDGTVRLGLGNAGSVSSDLATIKNDGTVLLGTAANIGTSGAKLQVLGSGTTGSLSLATSNVPNNTGSIAGIDGWGWDGSAYFATGTINFRAAENWSTTNHGSLIQFRTTRAGSGGALTERMVIDDVGRQITTFGIPSDGLLRRRAWTHVQSQINNPTIDLVTVNGSTINNTALVKVRVFQIAYLGSSGSSSNEHIGLASAWTNGSVLSTFVNTMTTTTVLNNSNVGTLSWTGAGTSTATLRYTANRASNYDSYYVEVEVSQNAGGNYTITFPA